MGCGALALVAACRENLSAPHLGLGPDTTGPLVQLAPARDTAVDSVGTLLVQVNASDPSGVGMVELFLQPAHFAIDPLAPNDTVFAGLYPITLSGYKHSQFKYWVEVRDLLARETVSDTVTVTVR